MGIERFYGTLVKSNVSAGKAVIKNMTDKVDVDRLYVDFNSIVYYVAEIIEGSLNTLLYHAIIKKINDSDIETIKTYNITYDTSDESNSSLISQIGDCDTNSVTIDMVENFIDMLCTSIVNPALLQLLYISIDGMPNMGKIWEQKKRRYSTSVMARLQKIIHENFKDSLSPERKLFEENRFRFDRSSIGPNSVLMDKIVERFMSPQFTENLRGVLPNLGSIMVNHHNIPGEGEKKIMEHILSLNVKGKYCIYSPDSDVVILSIILHNLLESNDATRGSTFSVVRRDQQKNHYDYVDTSKVINNILDFMYTFIDKNKINNNSINILNDVCFIITLFGNDFVSKMETVNISVHIDLLLEKYANVSNKSNAKYSKYKRFLLDNVDGVQSINWIFFMDFTEELSSIEHYLYGDLYLERHTNFRWFKRYMTKSTMTETVYNFVELINATIFPGIFNYKATEISTEKNTIVLNAVKEIYAHFGASNPAKLVALVEMTNVETLDAKLIEEGFSNIDKKSIDNTETFIKFFMSAHKFGKDKPKPSDSDTSNTIKTQVEFIFENFDFNEKHRFMKGKIYKKDINDPYHIKHMEDDMPVPGMEVTEYDKEVHKLDKRLPPYNIMLNEDPDTDTLGKLRIRYVKRKNVPKYEIFQQSAKNNYDEFVTNFMELKVDDDTELTKITENYIMGLCWVLDFYMNKNDKYENLNHVSVWFFPHYYAPTLYMICNYMKNLFNVVTAKLTDNKQKKKLFNEFMKAHTQTMFSTSNKRLYVPRHDFMNKQEHYLFVNPVSSRDPSKVDDFYMDVRGNRELFPDLRHLAKEMLDNKDKFLKHMNCMTALYNSKCKMDEHLMPATDFHTYMEKIKESVGDKREVPSLNGMNDVVTYI